jgi:hypothetical protein
MLMGNNESSDPNSAGSDPSATSDTPDGGTGPSSAGDAGAPSADDAAAPTAPANGNDASMPAPAAAGSDGGAIVVTDAGAPVTAFTGAPAFASVAGPSARKSAHNFSGNSPTTNPAGRACFSCHGAGDPSMVFGGTVYADLAGTIPAASVEVRVGSTTVHTDQDGNFYLLGAALKTSSLTGVRDATSVRPMASPITNGNCNGCHTGGTGTARIHLP